MTQQTLTRLRNLKLTGMADAVQQQLEQASTYEGLPFIGNPPEKLRCS